MRNCLTLVTFDLLRLNATICLQEASPNWMTYSVPHPGGFSTLLFIFLFRTLLLKPPELVCRKWSWHDDLTVGHLPFSVRALGWTYFEYKCILCCSTHERHAFYMWNLWKIIQTQYVTQGALLAAFWREALQMRGKECVPVRPRPRDWPLCGQWGRERRLCCRPRRQAVLPQNLHHVLGEKCHF